MSEYWNYTRRLLLSTLGTVHIDCTDSTADVLVALYQCNETEKLILISSILIRPKDNFGGKISQYFLIQQFLFNFYRENSCVKSTYINSVIQNLDFRTKTN